MAAPPGRMGPVAQVAVTAIWGVVRLGQVTLAVAETGAPQRLAAVTLRVSVTEQLVGAR